MEARPRLLYFNGPWDYLGERLIVSYVEPFRRLLDQDFEVVSLSGDRDFAAEVKKHSPDMVLFHTGTESPLEREVTITHTDAYPDLPRVGFVFRDPASPSRLAAMNRLRTWRVNQVFTDFRASDSPCDFFKDSIYLPWWVDDTVFRDYGETKELPITLTGSGWLSSQFYTWRRPVFLQLAPRLPVFHVPAFGTHQKNDAYVGESYARLLNRSLFSGGCGSVSRYITLKLLEIPATRCCLLTEETEALKAAGFADGVNCVFATPENVAAKVQALLDDPARLQGITDAGFQLVHAKHTQRNRRQFAEWLQLWKARKAGERIVQVHPFEPLQLVDAETPSPASTFPVENPLNDALLEGYRLLEGHQEREALAKFEWVIGIIAYVAEARLGAAMCHLRLGDANAALQHLARIVWAQVNQFAYKRPDPISLSLHAIALVRAGDLPQAFNVLASTAPIKHPALNALRWTFSQRWQELRRKSPAFQIAENDETQNVESVHLLPSRSFASWAATWSEYLAA